MKDFADLYARLDATTSSNAKLAALRDYFLKASDADAAWAVYFLAGGRPRRLAPAKALRDLALQTSGLPEWLFEESYQAVGDLAETISLLLPRSVHRNTDTFAAWVEERLFSLRDKDPESLALILGPWLGELDRVSQMVFIKLITGSFRVGVSRLLITRALATVAEIDPKRVAQRLVGYASSGARPTAESYRRLLGPSGGDEQADTREGQPYPFFLAHALPPSIKDLDAFLGPPGEWQIEWKWDGIRAQLVKRAGEVWIWSRGEELVTDRFPDLARIGPGIPDGTVIDGEIVVWKDGRAQPFAQLQQRIGRTSLSQAFLDKVPVAMLAYDLLEREGEDWRERPQSERRAELERLVGSCACPALRLSPILQGETWTDLADLRAGSRDLGVEGLMLKGKDSLYGVGRTKDVGVWWKWKIEPYAIDAVLVYAQRGSGRRASLYTDFTFAVWDGPRERADRKLVPFAKAYSGLTDEEMRRVDAIVRKTTLSRFGPVRAVTPTMVFELGFEGIAPSTRHKSGIAVRFPRILRWREDKPFSEADTLDTLRGLLSPGASSEARAGSDASGTTAAGEGEQPTLTVEDPLVGGERRSPAMVPAVDEES